MEVLRMDHVPAPEPPPPFTIPRSSPTLRQWDINNFRVRRRLCLR
jgi:hypothetical protein